MATKRFCSCAVGGLHNLLKMAEPQLRVLRCGTLAALIGCVPAPMQVIAAPPLSRQHSPPSAGSENSVRLGEATNMLSKSEFVLVAGGELPDIGNGRLSVSSFYMSKHEVTFSHWKMVLAHRASDKYEFEGNAEAANTNHPVVFVNWYDCVKWCNLRSEIEGRKPVYLTQDGIYRAGRIDDLLVITNATGFRLPTDEEWEYAARGGSRSRGYVYSGSDDLNEVGWYRANSSGAKVDMDGGRGTWPVGLKLPNEIGLYDMSGNVWEWCYDWHPDYEGGLRVRRGGSWRYFRTYCRVSVRYMNGPKFARNNIGFRCAVTAD